MKQKLDVSLSDIQKAKIELATLLPPTPMVYSNWLSEKYHCHLYLKLENMQPIGSFKIRGATYKISQLTKEQRKRGVIAASAGNHAQGVAWGSTRYKTSSLIVMPKEASVMKVENTRLLGAEVHLEGANYDEAYEVAKRISKKTGRVFVHAYRDEHVIAGQGTVGLEILEQLPDVDVVVASVGGGGLLAGTSLAIKELRPQTQIIGCQATGADSMFRSFKKKRAQCSDHVNTFADGIAVAAANPDMYAFLSQYVDMMVEADDEAIAAAVLALLEKAKTVVEGAGALPLAVLDRLQSKIKNKKVCVIISGGNIDVNLLSRIIDRGLTLTGRRIRVNVWIPDRPGALSRLTELLAQQETNILQAIHDRSEPLTTIDRTEVQLTLETKGEKHSQEIIQALKKHVLHLELVS